jgi:hypothetical protein
MSTNTEIKEFTKVKKFPVGNTGNALTSLSDDHIIGTAGDIYDTEFHDGAYQSEINRYLDNNFSSYLPLTGGEINGTVIFKDDYNGELSIGPKYISIGSNLETNITSTSISFKDKDTNESNEFNIYGVKYPLTVLYRDVNNNPVKFEYKAGNPVEGDSNAEEPGNNLNTIDLSRGVYYATTARTATNAKESEHAATADEAYKVSNKLSIKVKDTITEFDGSKAESITVDCDTIGAATKDHTHNYAGSDTPGGAANSAK